MHPTIRVLSFLVFAAFVAGGQGVTLAFASALVAGLYLGPGAAVRLRGALRLLRRLRWLLLSIVVLYGWFTPGAPLWPAQQGLGWIPTREGLLLGALRAYVLVLMVLAIAHVLQVTPRAGLVAALRWLAAPLRPLGLDPDRLALRVVLVLDTLGEVQALVGERVARLRAERVSRRAAAGVAAEVFAEVVRRAEVAPPQAVVLPQDRPRAHEWAYPPVLAGAFLLLQWLAA